MRKILALTVDGKLTYCTAPEELRGKGRCNHVFHQRNGQNIDDFMFYVQQVDSIPGLLQGDVSEKTDNGTIEYAVKSHGASFMSLQNAITTAIEILNADPPFNKSALEAKKAQLAEGIRPRNQ